MPPDLIGSFQGILRGFLDRRVAAILPEDPPRQIFAPGQLPLTTPVPFPADASGFAVPPQPRFQGLPELAPMAADAAGFAAPPAPPPPSLPPEHRITGPGSLFEAIVPDQVREVMRIRRGGPLGAVADVANTVLDAVGQINPTEFLSPASGGALWAGGVRQTQSARQAISGALQRQTTAQQLSQVVHKAPPEPSRSLYNTRVVQEFAHNTPELNFVAARVSPNRFVVGDQRTLARPGSIVFEEPPRLPRNIREARADQLGYTTEAIHASAKNQPWEGLPGPDSYARVGSGLDDAPLPWSHFGTARSSRERMSLQADYTFQHTRFTQDKLAGRIDPATRTSSVEGMGYWTPMEGSPVRSIPVRLRGPFLQTDDLMNWDPWTVLTKGVEAGLFDPADVERIKNVVRNHERTHGYSSTLMRGIQQKVIGEAFQSRGIRGLRYRNAVEDKGSISYMIFGPENARSTISAEFNPSQTHLPGLLRMLAGVGVGAGAGAAMTQGGGSQQ